MARAATRAICRASSGSLQNVQAATRPSGPSTAYSVPHTGHRTDQAVSAGAFCASDSTAAPSAHGRLGAHLHAEHHVGQLQRLAAEQRLGRAAAQIRPDATTLHGRPRCGRVLDGPAPFAVDGHHGMDAGHPRREEVGREVAGAPKDAAWGRYADDLPAPHVFQKQGITCAFVRKSASASGAAHRIVGVGEAAGAQAHAISSPLSRCRCACASALRASPPHLLRRG